MLPADLMITALLTPGFWKLRCCKAWRFLAARPALSSKLTESYLELCIGATAEAAVVEDLSMHTPALSYLQDDKEAIAVGCCCTHIVLKTYSTQQHYGEHFKALTHGTPAASSR